MEVRPEHKNRCWIALKYTKPKSKNTTLALIGSNKKIAVIMQDVKALVRRNAFLPPPIFPARSISPEKEPLIILLQEISSSMPSSVSQLKKYQGQTL